MDEPKNINPLTGKKRTISNGTELGDLTEHYHVTEKREDRHKILKSSPELQKHFRISDYADLET